MTTPHAHPLKTQPANKPDGGTAGGEQQGHLRERVTWPAKRLSLSGIKSAWTGLDLNVLWALACTLLLTHFRYAINMRARRARTIKTIAS